MTPKKLVLELCSREGKLKQVNVAQMTEIVSKLADIIADELQSYPGDDSVYMPEGGVVDCLVVLGQKRLRKRYSN